MRGPAAQAVQRRGCGVQGWRLLSDRLARLVDHPLRLGLIAIRVIVVGIVIVLFFVFFFLVFLVFVVVGVLRLLRLELVHIEGRLGRAVHLRLTGIPAARRPRLAFVG